LTSCRLIPIASPSSAQEQPQSRAARIAKTRISIAASAWMCVIFTCASIARFMKSLLTWCFLQPPNLCALRQTDYLG
jgi:hypothetical protein